MAITSYLQIHLESMGTSYVGDGISPTSLAGHMWYEVYQKDENGSIIPNSQQNSGYTGHGITNDDGQNYADDPAYSSKEVELSQEQYNILFNFGVRDSTLAAQNGFGPDDYNVFNNSCIYFTWKALELAGFNPGGFEGNLVPMWNRAALEAYLFHNFSYNAETHSTIPLNVNELYLGSQHWTPPRRDPLVLDLDGDGIETLGITSTTQVLFDYDGDGVKTGTGWIKGDDGFLVLDRNGNGVIDNGGELFGDQTLVNGVKATDGFAALSAQDSNHNGQFDAGDTNFINVRIWQDTNSDGISQAGELHTLSELGTPQGGLSCFAIHLLTSINLTSTTSNNQNFKNVRKVA